MGTRAGSLKVSDLRDAGSQSPLQVGGGVLDTAHEPGRPSMMGFGQRYITVQEGCEGSIQASSGFGLLL